MAVATAIVVVAGVIEWMLGPLAIQFYVVFSVIGVVATLAAATPWVLLQAGALIAVVFFGDFLLGGLLIGPGALGLLDGQWTVNLEHWDSRVFVAGFAVTVLCLAATVLLIAHWLVKIRAFERRG
jgi:hypothetical protein